MEEHETNATEPTEAINTPANETQAAIDAGIQIAGVTSIPRGDLISVVEPAGAEHYILDLEKYEDQPRRQTGTVHAQRAIDLINYVKRFDNKQITTLWVDAIGLKITAVLNDHGEEAANWGDHRAILALNLTEQWKHWTSQDGQLLAQEEFADHVEYGREDVIRPDGATLLEIAQTIQGKTDVKWKAAKRLADGQVGMEYVEDMTAHAGATAQLQIPEEIELALSPFDGEEAYKVTARLRWRISGGNIKFGYRLDRPDEVLRDAVAGIVDRLEKEFSGGRVFQGAPR